jgi:nitroreductase
MVTSGDGEAAAVTAVIRGRRSVRQFRPDPLSDEVLNELLEAVRWAPSADNGQPWYVVVVRDESTKQRLNAVAAESRDLYELWAATLPQGGRLSGLPDFTEIPLCLAVFADPRQAPAYVEGEQSHILAAGMAIQNLWLAAHARGLGACLWTHLEQDQMKSILGVPHHYYFAGVVGVGYPMGDRERRGRKSLSEIAGYEWFKTRPGEGPPPEKLDLLHEFLRD